MTKHTPTQQQEWQGILTGDATPVRQYTPQPSSTTKPKASAKDDELKKLQDAFNRRRLDRDDREEC